MTGPASRARGGFDRPRDVRFGVALLAACALHAAVILGVDLPAPDSSLGKRALDIRLTLTSPPAASAETSREPESAPTREEAAVAPSDAWQSGVTERDPATGSPATVVSRSDSVRAEQPRAEPGSVPAIDGRSQRQSPPPDFGDGPCRRRQEPRIRRTGEGNRQCPRPAGAGRSHRGRRDEDETPHRHIRKIRRRSRLPRHVAAQDRADRPRQLPPGGLSGELLLLAVIHRDGTLLEVRVLEPSRHPALDAAALRTVRLAAPFSHFPTEMRKSYDRLEIVRRWRFAREGTSLR